jgi:dipeptidyl aminopeptidase/acylaminoacyl peptidase
MHFSSVPCRRAALALLFTLSLPFAAAAAAPSEAAAVPPPLASFFDNSAFGGAILSPSGRYLAARSGAPGRRVILVVVDLQENTLKVVANFRDADVGNVMWVNDERLVLDVTDSEVGPRDVIYGAGLFAVNRDGSKPLQLADRRGQYLVSEGTSMAAKKILPWNTFLMEQAGAQDSEWIYVTRLDFDTEGQVENVSLLRLNTLTGQNTAVQRPARVDGWLLDHQGKPRLASGHERDRSTIYYLDPAIERWRTLASFRSYGGDEGGFVPVGFGADGTLYVTARGDKDTVSLHAFDFKTGKIKPEPLVETKGYDFSGGLVANRAKLLGVHYETDARGSVWFDPAMRAVQEKIDRLLPSTVNLISVAAGPESPWVLVRSYSDVQPSIYMLYNLQTDKLNKVGESRPGVDPRRMAHQDVFRYKARDGLEIPALLTLPPGTPKGAKLPLVVLVHGGPYVRGTAWGWNGQTQFLASRGYAVLEPEFRGSTGYGARHFTAGWKQWGLKMQDDIADGARWAIAQGIADPKRICIAGASYGGYATLMGLIKDPDLYRCGIDWVGVTDIQLLYDGHWSFKSDMSDEWKEYGMPELVGDPVKDAAQLAATSPLRQAARLRQPLLMAYGGVDHRVPMYHGRKFHDAVTETNKQVEWIEYQEEGHGWSLPKNRIDFWGRVEKFLDKNIGQGAAIQ